MRFDKTIAHWYEIKRDLFLEVIRNFVNRQAKFCNAVNA